MKAPIHLRRHFPPPSAHHRRFRNSEGTVLGVQSWGMSDDWLGEYVRNSCIGVMDIGWVKELSRSGLRDSDSQPRGETPRHFLFVLDILVSHPYMFDCSRIFVPHAYSVRAVWCYLTTVPWEAHTYYPCAV